MYIKLFNFKMYSKLFKIYPKFTSPQMIFKSDCPRHLDILGLYSSDIVSNISSVKATFIRMSRGTLHISVFSFHRIFALSHVILLPFSPIMLDVRCGTLVNDSRDRGG